MSEVVAGGRIYGEANRVVAASPPRRPSAERWAFPAGFWFLPRASGQNELALVLPLHPGWSGAFLGRGPIQGPEGLCFLSGKAKADSPEGNDRKKSKDKSRSFTAFRMTTSVLPSPCVIPSLSVIPSLEGHPSHCFSAAGYGRLLLLHSHPTEVVPTFSTAGKNPPPFTLK